MKTYKAGELRGDMLVVPVHMLEAATPSGDGGEVPKFDRLAIADRVNRMCVLMAGANTLKAAEFAVEECQSELERIVAAKDAEIARLGELVTHLKGARDAYGQNAIDAAATARGLRAQLAAQQAAVPEGWLVPVRREGKRFNLFTEALPFIPFDGVTEIAGSMTPLYAHPAAPQQGVVIPERDKSTTNWPEEYAFQSGWNACLDEFARLNADRSAQGEKP